MSETYVTYKVWDGCKAPTNLEYNGRLIGQIMRESAIDRDALLTLTEEMIATAKEAESIGFVFNWRLYDFARRIREILGEES